MDDDAELKAVLARADPCPLANAIPAELRDWLLPIAWDRERLWAIERARLELPLRALRWHYPLPWWDGRDQRPFTLRPAEFLADPAAFPEHKRLVDDVDLHVPIHVLRRRGRWLILDGLHRVVRAELDGAKAVTAVPVRSTDLAAVILP